MAIKISKNQDKIKLNLNGPDGNAMVLISTGAQLLKKLGEDQSVIKKYKKDMMSNNYNYIVKTFDEMFSEFIDLEMSEELYNSIFMENEEFL